MNTTTGTTRSAHPGRLAAVLTIALVLAAGCGGVDRAGTKKVLLEKLATSGASEPAKKCIADSIDSYSDTQLKQLESGKADTALTSRFTDTITKCIGADLDALVSGDTSTP